MNFGKRFLHLFALLIISSCFAFAQRTYEGHTIKLGVWKGDSIEYVAGLATVKMKAISDTSRLKRDLQEFNGALKDFPAIISSWRLIQFPESLDVFTVIQQVRKFQYIEIAEPSLIHRNQ